MINMVIIADYEKKPVVVFSVLLLIAPRSPVLRVVSVLLIIAQRSPVLRVVSVLILFCVFECGPAAT